jgi:hypothetical protein
MRRIWRIVGLALIQGLVLVGAAGAWDLRGDAPRQDFEAFHRRFTSDVYFYPRHGAHPLGWTGFEVWVDTSVDPGFGDEDFAATAIDGDLPGDALAFARVGALIRGGAVTPALGLRATVTRTLDAGSYDLDQYGLELLASKGFTVVTLFGGAGVVRSESTLDRSVSGTPAGRFTGRITEKTTRNVVFAGVTLKLLIPRLTISLEQGEELQGAVRVGFGF